MPFNAVKGFDRGVTSGNSLCRDQVQKGGGGWDLMASNDNTLPPVFPAPAHVMSSLRRRSLKRFWFLAVFHNSASNRSPFPSCDSGEGGSRDLVAGEKRGIALSWTRRVRRGVGEDQDVVSSTDHDDRTPSTNRLSNVFLKKKAIS